MTALGVYPGRLTNLFAREMSSKQDTRVVREPDGSERSSENETKTETQHPREVGKQSSAIPHAEANLRRAPGFFGESCGESIEVSAAKFVEHVSIGTQTDGSTLVPPNHVNLFLMRTSTTRFGGLLSRPTLLQHDWRVPQRTVGTVTLEFVGFARRRGRARMSKAAYVTSRSVVHAWVT